MAPPIWHGTPAESLELQAALSHNCSCVFDEIGARTVTCVPHRLLIDDQRALDGLVFMRYLAKRLLAEEGRP